MERLTIIDGCGNDELARCMNCGLEKAGENLENCGMCEEGWRRALRRLAAYEDTGLEPEEIYEVRFLIAAQRDPQKLSRLRELVLADQDGRLVALDEPMRPLVWGDDNRDTILCPTCNHDLMGGFPEANSCEAPMYQCPYCGQPIDGTKALTREEAEAALAGGK